MSTQFSGNHEISVNEIVENRMKQDVSCTSIRRLSSPAHIQSRAVLQERTMKVLPMFRISHEAKLSLRHSRCYRRPIADADGMSGRILENTPLLVNSPNF